MAFLIISFIAGILTVLAPCTISLLPVIVGGSVSEGQSFKKALAVTISLGVSVILFTLVLKVSTAFIHIPQSFWEIFSGVIIFLLGIAMLFPKTYEKIPGLNALNLSSNKLLAVGYQKKNLTGDILIGAALGPVFSSCSPTYFIILATVIPKSFGAGFIDLLAYAVGLSGALLVVAFAGQKLMTRLGIASDPNSKFKKVIGILFLVVGVAIASGYDRTLETALTNGGIWDITAIEQKLLRHTISESNTLAPEKADTSDITLSNDGELSTTSTQSAVEATKDRVALKSLQYPAEPEIANPSAFLNTDGQPITFSQFKGKKVVLVDFWTYSCINCQRTLPYVKAWYDKYSSEGLEIISIHTPEFAFEKDKSNVQKAVDNFGIKYPVVMDNAYGTWNAFQNQYWPRKYLIDIDGYIVYDHSGEGNYRETEAAIQKALAERARVLDIDTSTVSSGTVDPDNTVSVDNRSLGSSETYFGASRNEYLANGLRATNGIQKLTVPTSDIRPNKLYLGGTWNFFPEYAESQGKTSIVYKYQAKNVYFVASAKSAVTVHVLVDGNPVGTMAGSDVKSDGTVTIQADKLYHLILNTDYAQHTLELDIDGAGLDAYTFTFG